MQETALDEEDLDALADWSHQANLYASAENGFDDDLETRHMLEYADKEYILKHLREQLLCMLAGSIC